MKEGAIFNCTRLANYTCEIPQTCNTDKLVTNVVTRAAEGFNLQCSNVARQVKENFARITITIIYHYHYFHFHLTNMNTKYIIYLIYFVFIFVKWKWK